MIDGKKPITNLGLKNLKKQHTHLQEIVRPKIIEEISRARALGDLSENAEYQAAKSDQARNEKEIRSLEEKISKCYVPDLKSLNQQKVNFSSYVTLWSDEKEVTYQIVGEYESDVEKKKIAVNSPLARSLLGKKENDEVTVRTPKGTCIYEITNIEYDE